MDVVWLVFRQGEDYYDLKGIFASEDSAFAFFQTLPSKTSFGTLWIEDYEVQN
jgi:hypothetical protein